MKKPEEPIPPRRPRTRRRTGTPTYVAPEDMPTYPPDPFWVTDERGRFHYKDYDGESLVVWRDPLGDDIWIDKRGEGPVFIRKEDVAVIIEAIMKASA